MFRAAIALARHHLWGCAIAFVCWPGHAHDTGLHGVRFVAWGQAVRVEGEPRPPANSLEHVQCAAELGFEAIELDIRMSGDGVPVLAHDDPLPGGRRVSKLSFSALADEPLGEWRGDTVRMASLEQVLRLEKRPRVIIADMRVRLSDADRVAAVVKSAGMEPRDFVFTAYDMPRAQAFRRALPGASVFLKTYDMEPDIEWIDRAGCAGLSGIMFQVKDSFSAPVGEWVRTARDRGLSTMSFVHTAGHGRKRIEAQVDAGVDHILTTRRYDGPRSCGPL